MKRLFIASICMLGSAVAFVSMTGKPRMASTHLCTEPLASEGDWSAYLDQDNTGMVYYFNAKTGESMWEPPTETFPSAKMNLKTRQAARAKQSQFLKQAAEEPRQADDEPKRKGLLSSILENEKEVVKEKSIAEEQPNWFDGLFEIKAETPTKGDSGYSSGTAETPKKEDTGFFSGFLGGRRKEDERNVAVNGDNKLATDIQEKAKFSTLFTGSTVGTRPIELDVASVVLPHPQKVSWGGEDAVFVKGRTFGVFDGVSGADKLDGIPLFSYTLADELKRMLNDEGVTIKQIIDSLNDAADFANRAATGASTAVVGAIGKDGFLRVLNVGDSVCLVVRGDKVVARTKDIVHYFDCPYQFSEDSPDRAQDGTRLNFEVLPGDVVVMGSDGVFDNLDEKRIIDEIRASPERSTVIARRIVDLSRQVSLDDDAPTPYAKLAKRNGFEDFQRGRGGKLDDVSCVVVRCL